jgi:hypothetical protein
VEKMYEKSANVFSSWQGGFVDPWQIGIENEGQMEHSQ